jgi:sugar phosphate isomerase/epimerase
VRLGLNSITIRQAPTLRDRIAIAAHCGYEEVELWMHEVAPASLTEADRREAFSRYGARVDADANGVVSTLEATRKSGIEVAGVCLPTHAAVSWHDSIDPAVLESLHRTIEVCAELSGQYVIMPMLGEEGTPARTADNLAKVAEHAARYGVRLGFEPVGHVRKCARIGEALEVLERAGAPEHTGLILDLFHFFRAGQSPADLEGLPVEKVLAVHLNDAMDLPREQLLGHRDRVYPGQGIFDARGFTQGLARAGYRGRYVVEILNPAYWAEPAERVAETAFGAAAALFAESAPSEAPRQGASA